MGEAFQEPGLLSPGTPAPRFNIDASGRYRFYFDTLAGRYTLLAFLGGPKTRAIEAALTCALDNADLFDGENMALFWVNSLPSLQPRLQGDGPRVQVLPDYDLDISRLFGVAEMACGQAQFSPVWIVLDPRLRVIKSAPIENAAEIFAFLRLLPPAEIADGDVGAPALIVPRVFEPQFCQALIDLHQNGRPQDSGFMRQTAEKDVHVLDPDLKRRRDIFIDDAAVRDAVRLRFQARLIPEILQAFNFEVTRMERDLIACYDSDTGGFFKPHRDNTSPGTLHRRFAVTLNLNAEDYEGGDLRFPEFGKRTYRAPTGGAVVFSCSLMHEALPVTSGRRYAFLPFLYDEEGEKIRLANLNRLS